MAIVEVPGFGRVEFPDGMSDAEIVAAIKRSRAPAQIERSYDPAEGMSVREKLLAGAGKAYADIGNGVGQLLGLVSQQEIDETKRRDAPLMKTGAGVGGNVLGNAVTALPLMFTPGAQSVVGAGLAGGALGALQPVGTGDSRAVNAGLAAFAGGAGQGLANTLGRAVQPVRSTLPGPEAALAEKAQKIMALNAAQQTGSKPLRWIDSALDNLPFTADKQAAAKLAQRQAWQRGVLAETGEAADKATADVLGNAYSRLGAQFRDLSARNTVTLGNDFLEAVAKIDAGKTPFSKGLDDVVNRALDLASRGTLSGTDYQTVRTSIGNASKGAWQQNPELGQALKSLRNALDDSAAASMSEADRDAWKAIREQYKALKSIEKASDSTTGQISPKKLFNELARANPQGMRYGFGNQSLPDLARIGKQFVAEVLPDSGTAQRSWYMNALQNPTAGLGGLLGFIGGGAPGAMFGAAAGAGVPLAAQKALWANGPYLRQGLLDAQVMQKAAPYINALAAGGLLSATNY